MNDHYYSETPSSESRPCEISVEALGQSLRFILDAGVFSKRGLDAGTEILLNSLPELRGRVLDLGCGWGALGLPLARKYPAARFILSDLNERALGLCRKSALLNGISNAEIVKSDGFQSVSGSFDFILSNPPIRIGKKALYGWFAAARERLNAGGFLYLVMRKQQGAESALNYLQTVFPRVERINREKGYWIIACEKGNADEA